MYAYPTRLPQVSNREDLVFTVSIFDDDTGNAVNLSGITKLNILNGVTSSNWLIADGFINTTSHTTFFVPPYPIGNQLLAATFVVGTGLAILAGDPVTITDVGNAAQMVGYVISYTPQTGTLVVQISINVQMEIRAFDRHRWYDDYSPWYDWGGAPSSSPPGGQPQILATLGQGLSIIDVGYVGVNIPVSMMQQLRHRTYMCSMAMTDSVNTRQIFIAELPMLYGGMEIMPWAQQTMTTPAV